MGFEPTSTNYKHYIGRFIRPRWYAPVWQFEFRLLNLPIPWAYVIKYIRLIKHIGLAFLPKLPIFIPEGGLEPPRLVPRTNVLPLYNPGDSTIPSIKSHICNVIIKKILIILGNIVLPSFFIYLIFS